MDDSVLSIHKVCLAVLSFMQELAPEKHCGCAANGKVGDSFTSIHEAPLHYSGRGHGRDAAADGGVPPENVLQEIDAQELNRMFVRRWVSPPVLSGQLPY